MEKEMEKIEQIKSEINQIEERIKESDPHWIKIKCKYCEGLDNNFICPECYGRKWKWAELFGVPSSPDYKLIETKLKLEETLKEMEQEYKSKRQFANIVCTYCSGNGWIYKGERKIICKACNGNGYVEAEIYVEKNNE